MDRRTLRSGSDIYFRKNVFSSGQAEFSFRSRLYKITKILLQLPLSNRDVSSRCIIILFKLPVSVHKYFYLFLLFLRQQYI